MGALMVQITLGTLYGFSAFVEPLKTEFKWTAPQIQHAFMLAIASFAVVMVFAGRWQDKVGPRIPALVGGGLLTLGCLLAAQVRSPEQHGLFVLAFGLVYGSGIGLAYVCPIACLAKWFPDIKGLITGIAVAGFGGGAAFFIPNVKKFLGHSVAGPLVAGKATKLWVMDHHIYQFFQIHAIAVLVAVTIGALLLKNPPAGWVAPKKAEGPGGPVKTAPKPAVADVAPGQMIGTPRFWMLWAMFMAGSLAGLMTISFAAAIAGAGAASVLAVFNAGGRIGWGAVSDRIGRHNAITAMFIFQALVMLALMLVNKELKPDTAQAIVLMGLVGLNFGGCLAVFPSATSDAFGTKNLGINYGLVFTAYGVAGVVGPLMGAHFKEQVKSYTPAFMIAAILVGIAAVISLGMRPKPVPAEA